MATQINRRVVVDPWNLTYRKTQDQPGGPIKARFRFQLSIGLEPQIQWRIRDQIWMKITETPGTKDLE
jgi:hypothetical protein